MEIDTQQLEGLLRAQEQQATLLRKNPEQGSGFEALLSRQLGAVAATTTDESVLAQVAQNGALAPVLLAPAAEETVDPDTAVLQAAFDQASGALDLWDSYASLLGTSASSTALRDAWGLLENIDSQVAQIRSNPALPRSAGLESILNELEIMTTTEKFKFNRGDYAI